MENVANNKWKKCKSKSHPGREYMFNTETGETKWLSSKDGSVKEMEIIKALPKLITRTPAQDRLKRLQNNFKKPEYNKLPPTKNNNNGSGAKKTNAPIGIEKKINPNSVIKDQDTKSPGKKLPLKRKNEDVPTVGAKKAALKNDHFKQPNLIPTLRTLPPRAGTSSLSTSLKTLPRQSAKCEIAHFKQPNLNLAHKTSPLLTRISSFSTSLPHQSTTNEEDNFKHPNSILAHKTSPLHNRLSSFSTRQLTKGEKDQSANQHKTSSPQTLTSSFSASLPRQSTAFEEDNFKHTKSILGHKTSPPQAQTSSYSTSAQILKPQSITAEKDNFKQPNLNVAPKPSPLSFLSNILNQFKNVASAWSNKNQTQNNNSAKPCSSNPVPLISKTSPVFAQQPTTTILKNSANKRLELLRQSLQQQQSTSNSTPVSDVNNMEPMDWQPIDIDMMPTLSTSNNVIKKINYSDSEHYATVNENLFRLAAEKESAMGQKWLPDFFYIIMDTNVMLRYLSFIEDLCEMQLCETKGTIVFIPYAVLQELDKLKMRSDKTGTMVLAIRAIKFLNEKLKSRYIHVKAQSALEERKHIIKITSADDSIINCCLQVKQQVKNSILISEDVNLRSKAISNDLLACSKRELDYSAT